MYAILFPLLSFQFYRFVSINYTYSELFLKLIILTTSITMIFHENVPTKDRKRIESALESIKKFGTKFHRQTAKFVRENDVVIYLDLAEKIGGSGSVQLNDQRAARKAVSRGNLNLSEAAKYVRMNIARETIDTGGQQGIEGTFVHEGKHARDFALMLSSFSKGIENKVFNPTAFQREYSAHLTSAFYLMRRGGNYAKQGISLGLLYETGSRISVNKKGIRSRLKNNYGLTEETPGDLLNTCSYPKIQVPRKKFLGIF